MLGMARLHPNHRLALITLLAAIVTVAGWLVVSDLRPAAAQYVQVADVPAATAESELGRFNPRALYEQRAAGVVSIAAYLPDAGRVDATHREIAGSGFVLDEQGYILTNSHVIRENGQTADYVFVDFASGDRVEATVVGIDPFSDLAVLQVDPVEVALEPVPLGDSDVVGVGEPVAVIGSPFGNDGSLSIGIVSATNRSIPAVVSSYDIPGAIQTDAAINRGNSGGPLFNSQGRVIGVTTQIRSESGRSEGVGFAVPINVARRAVDQIIGGGRVRYAFMGVNTTTVSPQMARELGLSSPTGALVTWLQPGGPAQRAGLSTGQQVVRFQGRDVPVGDQVVEVAGQPVRSSEDITRIVHRLDAGRPVEVVVLRGGTRHAVSVTPTERTP